MPNLDDRTFLDIVEEAKKMIPTRCPHWTDFNPSDPGITVVELLAWMTEMIIYRLNRIPEKNYLKFLELMGVRLRPQQPARAWIVCKTAERASQADLGKVAAGTRLSTTEIDGERIGFETDQDLHLSAAKVIKVVFSHRAADGSETVADLYPQAQDLVSSPMELPIFWGEAGAGIGSPTVSHDGGGYEFSIAVDLPKISPFLVRLLPLSKAGSQNITWQYSSPSGWQDIKPILDGSNGLRQTGIVEFEQLSGWAKRLEYASDGYWLRAVCRPPEPYFLPRFKGLHLNAVGAIQAESHRNEILGSSTGEPYQIFRFVRNPLLPEPEIIVRELDHPTEKQAQDIKKLLNGNVIESPTGLGLWVRWHEKENLFASSPSDRHYTLDLQKGEISFGDGRRGMVPPTGMDNIRANRYYTGGGSRGNVGRNTIITLNTPVAFVTAVSNPGPAGGGADLEGVEEAKLRAPWMLKHRYRAVTTEDFEHLAKEASGEVAKALCFAEEGRIEMVIVPKGRPDDLSERLELGGLLRQKVQAYLDERRLITTRLSVVGPVYKQVYLDAKIVLLPEKAGIQTQLMNELTKELRRFLHPLEGGASGEGWPLGRSIHISEIYYLLERVSGVDYVDTVRLREAPEGDGLDRIVMRDSDGRRAYPELARCALEISIISE